MLLKVWESGCLKLIRYIRWIDCLVIGVCCDLLFLSYLNVKGQTLSYFGSLKLGFWLMLRGSLENLKGLTGFGFRMNWVALHLVVHQSYRVIY